MIDIKKNNGEMNTTDTNHTQCSSIMVVDGQPITRNGLASLIEAYFECTATDAQERLLRRALAQCPWTGSDIDEARVAMGFASVGMALEQQARRARHRRVAWRAVAAAVVAVAVMAGALVHVGPGSKADECIAYVNGQKVTNQEQVMQMVRGNLSTVGEAHTGVDQSVMMQLASVGRAVGD